MSIVSMTEIAFRSRTDVGTPAYYPKTLPELAGAAGGKDVPESDANAVLRAVTTYVPTEILTVYVAVIAALGVGAGGARVTPGALDTLWATFYAFLVATPAVVWIVYATKVKTAGKPLPWAPRAWPLWEMAAGTIAYVAWAFALPGSAFAHYADAWYSPGLAGVVVLVASTTLGLLAPLFARSLPAG